MAESPSFAERHRPINKSEKPRVYLAGPMVFYTEEQMNETFKRMKEICAECGIEGIAPLDNQLDLTGVPAGKPLYRKIVQADIDLMKKADGALICFDPFRGTEMDTGTAVELGYLYGKGKPMSGWTMDTRDYRQKVIDYYDGRYASTASNTAGATSGTERDPTGMLIHSAGCSQNGMADILVEMSGGEVIANKNWEDAFRQAAKNIHEAIVKQREQRKREEAKGYIPYA
jgi:nucleoside 2-deoxyribosyltransferase